MDKFNRLTRNAEWQPGARYRWTKGRESKLVRSVRPPTEVTFLGWHHSGRRELVGQAVLLHADGSKVVSDPDCWRGRWMLITPPAGAAAASQSKGVKLGDEVTLLCPVCGCDHTHLSGEAVRVDSDGRNAVRGETVYLPGTCENGHHFALCFGQHKGRTLNWTEEDAVLPPVEDLAAVLKQTASRSARVEIDAKRNTAVLRYAYAYEIDLDLVPDEAALLRWLLHLCEKNWMDTERLHEVATAIGKFKGFDLDRLP